MRAPAISPASKLGRLALSSVALVLATTLAGASAVADEPADHAADGAAASELGAADVNDPATLAGYLTSGMLRVSADVTLAVKGDEGLEPIVGSFTFDGLTYAVTREGGAALVATSPEALASSLANGAADDPTGADAGSSGKPAALVIPASVEHDGVAYAVTSVGPRALAGCDADAIIVPVTVASVDESAFQGSAVAAVEVAEGNPTYSSYDGMLFDAEQISLLLIPEGKQGAARIPKTAEVVDPSSFSHSAGVSAIDVEAGSAAFSSRNGCLYDASGETLVAAPKRAAEEGSPSYERAPGTLPSLANALLLFSGHTFGLAPDGGTIHKYRSESGGWIFDGSSSPDDRDSYSFVEGDGFTKLAILEGNPYNPSDDLFFYIEYQDASYQNKRYRLYVTKNGYEQTAWIESGVSSPHSAVNTEVLLTRGCSYSPKWSARTYSISYAGLPDGTNTSRWRSSYTIEDEDFDLPTPSRAGYQFRGWRISGMAHADGSEMGDLTKKVSKGSYGNATCTAVWDTIEVKELFLKTPANTATRLVEKDGSWVPCGTVSDISILFLTGGTYEGTYVARVEPPRPGTSDQGYYCYIEFFSPANERTRLEFSRTGYESSGVSVGSLAIIAPAELPLVRGTWVTPSWNPISYSIDYAGLPEGTDASRWRSSYTIEDEDFDLPTPTLDGYAFDGWTWDATASPNVQIAGSLAQKVRKGSYGNLVLTPTWAWLVSSSVDPNGAVLERQVGENGSWRTVETIGSERTVSFRYTGRYAQGNVAYVEESPQGKIPCIEYVDGDGSLNRIRLRPDQQKADGWSITGFGPFTDVDARKPLERGTRYSILWGAFQVKLDGNANGAAIEGLPEGPIEVRVGSVVTLPEAKRYGHDFRHWSSSADGTGRQFGANTETSADALQALLHSPQEPLTLYAQWTPRYDLDVPVCSPGSVTFEADSVTGEVRVAPGSSAEGVIRSYMAVPVALDSLACEGLPARTGGGLELEAIFGAGSASRVHFTASFGDASATSAASLCAGETASLARLPIPAATSADAPGEVAVAYGLELDEGLPIPTLREAAPVARLAYTVSLPLQP